MTALNEGQHAGEFILSEPDRNISRKTVTVTVPSGGLEAGAVLGQLSADGKYVPYDDDETDGREDAAAILFDNVTDTGDQTCAVVKRLASVRRADLKYLDGTTDQQKTNAEADLEALLITVRD